MIEIENQTYKRGDQEESQYPKKLHPVNFEFFTFVGAVPTFGYGPRGHEKKQEDILDFKMEATSVTEVIVEE